MKQVCERKAIYKIENKINHKIYIGQSNDPERRWNEHCTLYENKKYSSLINQAIIKYGVENFTFEVIGWFNNYNDEEKRLIAKYRSLAPYGYNVAIGGEEPPVMKGENNPAAKISNETAELIKKDLKNFSIPRKTIVKKYKITEDIIRHIIDGSSWYDDNETYPLRPKESELNEMRVKKIIELLILSDIPMNKIGAEVGWGRSSAKEINAGRNHFDERLIYPVRNHKEENKKILGL